MLQAPLRPLPHHLHGTVYVFGLLLSSKEQKIFDIFFRWRAESPSKMGKKIGPLIAQRSCWHSHLLFFRVNDCLGQIKFNQVIVLMEFPINTICFISLPWTAFGQHFGQGKTWNREGPSFRFIPGNHKTLRLTPGARLHCQVLFFWVKEQPDIFGLV